jgi:hypothetical protein
MFNKIPCIVAVAFQRYIWIYCLIDVIFEVFMAVTLKNVIFWDVTPCGSCKSRCFGGMYRLHHQGDKNWQSRSSVSSNFLRLRVTANVPSSPILVTLMMEVICSSKTSVLTRATWCNIPEDCILYLIDVNLFLYLLLKNITAWKEGCYDVMWNVHYWDKIDSNWFL